MTYPGFNPNHCICVTKAYPGCPIHGERNKPKVHDPAMNWPAERGVPAPGPGVAEVHEGERFDPMTGPCETREEIK